MRHTAITHRESERPYKNRSYVSSDLDDRHFDALNEDDHVFGLNGYCLDALDEIPAGGMRHAPMWPAQTFAVRGMSLAELQERDALAEQLIAEILAEEAV